MDRGLLHEGDGDQQDKESDRRSIGEGSSKRGDQCDKGLARQEITRKRETGDEWSAVACTIVLLGFEIERLQVMGVAAVGGVVAKWVVAKRPLIQYVPCA